MATPAQIERQIQLETAQMEEGIAQLHSNTQKAKDKKYASSTVYAQKMLKSAIPLVATTIHKIRAARLLRGSAGPALGPMARHTMTIPDDVAALLTLKVLFDVCTDPRDKSDLANNVIDRVGIALEQEAKWRYFAEANPDYLKWITNHITRAKACTTGTMTPQDASLRRRSNGKHGPALVGSR